MPTVSIIVPVYNVAPHVDSCLASIAAQTFAGIEVLVIDDGSTDGSEKICEQWMLRDKRFCVLHQRNQGLSAARNTGLRIATGEYVQFVDSDDYVDPRYTELLLQAARKSGCPCAMCGYVKHHMDTQEEYAPTSYPTTINAHDCIESVLTRSKERQASIIFCVWNRIYHRSLFSLNDIEFPEGHVYEDVCVMVPLAHCSGTIALIPNILYHKNERLQSIENTLSVHKIAEIVYAYAVLRSNIEVNYPDLLPLESRYYEMVLILSLLRLPRVSDTKSVALLQQHRKESLAKKKNLVLPQDIHFALALRALSLAPNATAMMYRLWRKLRRV